jgi:hypothetical protein
VFATPFYPACIFLDVLLFEAILIPQCVLFEGQGFSALAAAAARRRREEAALADRRSRSNSPLSLSASPKLEIITGKKRCSYNNSSPFLSRDS